MDKSGIGSTIPKLFSPDHSQLVGKSLRDGAPLHDLGCATCLDVRGGIALLMSSIRISVFGVRSAGDHRNGSFGPGRASEEHALTKGKALSNAMRMGKRTLAGAAAGALGLALIPFVATTSAQAAGTSAANVSPVRYVSTTTTTREAVPGAYVSWSNALRPIGNSGTAQVRFLGTNVSGGKLYVQTALDADDSELSVLGSAVLNAGQLGAGAVGTDDSFIRIMAGGAGTYTGDIGNGTDTVTFSFTTTGAVASMELTPSTSSVPVGGTAALTLTLKDANGLVTQPDNSSVVALAATPSSGATVPASVAVDNAAFTRGVYAFDATQVAAGTTSVAGTGAGSLLTINAPAVTITTSGTISDDTIANWTVTAPANAIRTSGATAGSQSIAYQVPAGTTTVTVVVDDTTINAAGEVIRLAAQTPTGTVNGVSTAVTPVYVDVTTDANKKATATFTLGGAAIQNLAALTVSQVNAANTSAGIGDNTKVTITQKQPTVVAGDITVSPDDSNVAVLGATTTVTVTVDDSFGTPQAGWVVRAFRGANTSSGTFLTQGTTNASGEATVTVTNAAAAVNNTVEQYSFSATPPIGSPVSLDNKLQITYSTSGGVTSVSVVNTNPGSPATTPITNTTTSIPVLPFILVPAGGTVADAGTGTYTVATAAGTAGGNYTTFTPTATPLNAVTVTVPEGVKVASSLTGLLWNGGAQTVTVGSGEDVYVFGTETGEHDVTFTSGGITTTTKVRVATAPQFAYNIALSPTSQNVVKGAIGSATLTVTDVFGNPVQTALDDTGAVALVATGELLLAGFNTNLVAATGVDGTVRVAFIAGNASGEGSITATPFDATSASKTPAWTPTYIPPVGAPAPALTSVAEVKVGSGPDTTSIVIEGSRANRAIIVDGETSGIAAGTTVRPWIKFPGETQYTQGAASRQIVAVGDLGAGEFTWTRQTSKKTYVYFRTEDGTSQSLRVIIPGR